MKIVYIDGETFNLNTLRKNKPINIQSGVIDSSEVYYKGRYGFFKDLKTITKFRKDKSQKIASTPKKYNPLLNERI